MKLKQSIFQASFFIQGHSHDDHTHHEHGKEGCAHMLHKDAKPHTHGGHSDHTHHEHGKEGCAHMLHKDAKPHTHGGHSDHTHHEHGEEGCGHSHGDHTSGDHEHGMPFQYDPDAVITDQFWSEHQYDWENDINMDLDKYDLFINFNTFYFPFSLTSLYLSIHILIYFL